MCLCRQAARRCSGLVTRTSCSSRCVLRRWRPVIKQGLRDFVANDAPDPLSAYTLPPAERQGAALDALAYYRDQRRWKKGVIILPTGAGKTVLSALDARSLACTSSRTA